jgi:hypothetical protein
MGPEFQKINHLDYSGMPDSLTVSLLVGFVAPFAAEG